MIWTDPKCSQRERPRSLTHEDKAAWPQASDAALRAWNGEEGTLGGGMRL